MKRGKLSLSWGLGAAALSLMLGVVAGRWATRQHADTATQAASQRAPSQVGSKRYKIPVTDSQPSLGPKDALVTIVEWCDLPDAGCAAIEPALQSLLDRYKDVLRLVFRHYGRPTQAGSAVAHQFLEAAHEQAAKFWQARALLLKHHGEFTPEDAERYSGKLGLDWKAVKAAMDRHAYISHITADRLFADMFAVQEVPALFVNGRPVPGRPTAQGLDQLVDEELTHAVELVAHGVPKADVYAELTKKGTWIPRSSAGH